MKTFKIFSALTFAANLVRAVTPTTHCGGPYVLLPRPVRPFHCNNQGNLSNPSVLQEIPVASLSDCATACEKNALCQSFATSSFEEDCILYRKDIASQGFTKDGYDPQQFFYYNRHCFGCQSCTANATQVVLNPSFETPGTVYDPGTGYNAANWTIIQDDENGLGGRSEGSSYDGDYCVDAFTARPEKGIGYQQSMITTLECTSINEQYTFSAYVGYFGGSFQYATLVEASLDGVRFLGPQNICNGEKMTPNPSFCANDGDFTEHYRQITAEILPASARPVLNITYIFLTQSTPFSLLDLVTITRSGF